MRFLAQIPRLVVRYFLSLLAASLGIFILMRAIPGNPAEVALGISGTPETVAQLSAQLGTDRPLVVQYLSWMGDLLTGRFGVSLSSGQDMTAVIWDRAAVSLILCASAMILATLLALPVGMWAAHRSSHVDGVAVSALSQIGVAVPSFLAGILLVSLVAVRLDWLPANGWVPPNVDLGGFLSRLILPVIALALVQASILSRYVRSEIIEIQSQPFMRTARAKGLSRWHTLTRHGMRAAALSTLTVAGVQMTSLIVGAVVIEKVFVIPGLGTLLLDAVANRDLITVQSTVMLLVVFTLTVNLVIDILYTVVDPRVAPETRRPQ